LIITPFSLSNLLIFAIVEREQLRRVTISE